MGGVFMIVFSFVYPLERKQRLELDVNSYNQKVEILNLEIIELKESVDELKVSGKRTINKLEILKNDNNRVRAEKQIEELKISYNKNFFLIKQQEKNVLAKDISIKYEKCKIDLLQEHINSFEIFRWVFLIVGTFFLLYGLYGWRRITLLSENIQKKELSDKETPTNGK